jgi:carboxyl-terminal processing protease
MIRIHRRLLRHPVITFSAAAVTVTAFTIVTPKTPANATLQDTPKAIVDEAWQIVNREYVDRVAVQNKWLPLRQKLLSRDYATKEQAYAALREAFKTFDDVYTRFMDPKEFDSLNNQTQGELSGVGIRLDLPKETNVLTVVEPLPNSPASRAGVQAGDQIIAVDGKATKGLSIEDASALIRGETGTKVVLQLLRKGKVFNQPITRAKIELQTVRYSLRDEAGKRIGYIRLSDFSSHADEQMAAAIKDLNRQKVDAFVLDLRGNPGGLLDQSLAISQMWLENGDIVKTSDRSNVVEIVDRGGMIKTLDKAGKIRMVNRNGFYQEVVPNRPVLSKLPLAVLVDGNSASSAEILTGALQDNRRATIIGTHTFGKALVQSVHPLISDNAGLAVTIAHYYTPAGRDISKKGIAPDVEVKLTDADRDKLSQNPKLIGTMADPQYAKAISLLGGGALAEKSMPKTSQRTQ